MHDEIWLPEELIHPVLTRDIAYSVDDPSMAIGKPVVISGWLPNSDKFKEGFRKNGLYRVFHIAEIVDCGMRLRLAERKPEYLSYEPHWLVPIPEEFLRIHTPIKVCVSAILSGRMTTAEAIAVIRAHAQNSNIGDN